MDLHIRILWCFMNITLMSCPTWNFVWSDHPIIRCYNSNAQGEYYFNVFNTRILLFFFIFYRGRANINGIYVTCAATDKIQNLEYVPLTKKNMPLYQLFTFHIICLILWFSLEVDNTSWQRFDKDPELSFIPL